MFVPAGIVCPLMLVLLEAVLLALWLELGTACCDSGILFVFWLAGVELVVLWVVVVLCVVWALGVCALFGVCADCCANASAALASTTMAMVNQFRIATPPSLSE